jgi:hypothetical protein
MSVAALPENMLSLFGGARSYPDECPFWAAVLSAFDELLSPPRETNYPEQKEMIRLVSGVCRKYLRRIGARLSDDSWEEYQADTITLACERLARTADTGNERDLYRVVWDSARDARRMATSRKQHRIRWGLLEPDTDIPDGFYSENEEDSLFAILEMLPENVRDTALQLAVYHLPTIIEIGESIGKHKGNICRHIATMRKILADYDRGESGECAVHRAIRAAHQELSSGEWVPYTTAPEPQTKPDRRPQTADRQPRWTGPAVYSTMPEIRDDQIGEPIPELDTTPPLHRPPADRQTEPDVSVDDSGRLNVDGCRYPRNYSVADAIRDAAEILLDSPKQITPRIPADCLYRARSTERDDWPTQPSRRGLGARATLCGTVRTPPAQPKFPDRG